MLDISAGMEQKDSYVACLWLRSSSFQAAACAWLVFLVTIFLAVFPSVVDMLKIFGILVGMDQKDSTSLVVFYGSFWLVLLVAMLFALCFLQFASDPDAWHHAWSERIRRTVLCDTVWILLGDYFRKCFVFCAMRGSMVIHAPASVFGAFEEAHTSTCRWTLVFQRNAWFDSGIMLVRQTTEFLVWKWPFRRRHWQWHVQGWFACFVAHHVVFP